MDAEMQAWWEDYQQKQRQMQEESNAAARNEGLNQARNQGLNQGLNQGRNQARNVLLRLLRKRFGELPADVVARIEAAGGADIERRADRVLDAKSLSDVLETPS